MSAYELESSSRRYPASMSDKEGAPSTPGPYDTDHSKLDSSPAPDGGLRAWLVVAGGFLTYFATFGLLNSFGTFQALYQTEMLKEHTATQISWIGSIQVFLLFVGGLFFGPIFDIYGSKVLFFPGTLIYVASMMFTSLSTKYYQLILAQGILFGIGDAMLHGLAVGIVVSGSSVGGVAWPLLIEKLFNTVGFAWTCRICGFICLALLIPACFMVAPRTKPGTGPKVQIGGQEFKDLFTDKKFILLTSGMFLVFWGMFNPFFNLPYYGMSHGMSFYMSNILLSVLNGGSFVGRILSGFLADKLGRYYVMAGCAFLSGVLMIALKGIVTPAGIIVFSTLFGATSGGLISLQSSCVAEITARMELMGVNLGVLMAICSIAALTGNPISTALMASGSFNGFIFFSGVTLLVGSALVLGAKIVAIKQQSRLH